MSKVIAGDNYNYMFPLKNKDSSSKKCLDDFKLIIRSGKVDGQSLEFEMINVPDIFHNSIRRLILNEVPSVAIDKIYLWNNTSVLEDTDLQLRIGLVPLDIDPDMLKMYDGDLPKTDEDLTAFKSDSCLFFELIMQCEKREYIRSSQLKKILEPFTKGAIPKYIEKFNDRIDMSIYSDDLKWISLGNQKEIFTDVKAVDGILLNRIMPGEEINIRCVAVKGFGHDHAKFIPVSAAHGRPAPNIVLNETISGKDAVILQSLFPKGVIKIKHDKAVVANPLLMQRSNKNYEDIESLKGKVEFSFDTNHYIWKIESVRPKGQPTHKILIAGFQAMIDKCQFYLENLQILSDAMKENETGSVNAQTFAKKHLGKMCYVDIVKPKGNPKFPMFHFIGETATLGTSLSYMINERFGEEVMSAYTDIHNGIELTLQIVGRKIKIDTTEILAGGLLALSEYFNHMQTCFKAEYAKFINNDVNME